MPSRGWLCLALCQESIERRSIRRAIKRGVAFGVEVFERRGALRCAGCRQGRKGSGVWAILVVRATARRRQRRGKELPLHCSAAAPAEQGPSVRTELGVVACPNERL